MHHLLADEGCEPFLLDELTRAHPAAMHQADGPRWITTTARLDAPLVFSRQPVGALSSFTRKEPGFSQGQRPALSGRSLS